MVEKASLNLFFPSENLSLSFINRFHESLDLARHDRLLKEFQNISSRIVQTKFRGESAKQLIAQIPPVSRKDRKCTQYILYIFIPRGMNIFLL